MPCTAEPVRAVRRLRTTCAIVGGGPAGLMLGWLLARAGVAVTVLEKHADFLRDFRGDTIHPSTLRVIERLGLLDDFLKLPHARSQQLSFVFGSQPVPVVDFATLGGRTGFMAMMPQWDFLNFVAAQARGLPGFSLLMQARAETLLIEDGRVCGLRAATPEGPVEVAADLVVAADGRHSDMRDAAGLVPRDLGAPIDVLWFRLARRAGDPGGSLGRLAGGMIAVMLDRGDYWQIAAVVPKGAFAPIREAGLAAFRARVARTTGFAPERMAELDDWEAVKLLNVRLDRLERWWRPGFLAIGDAAHAMSPVGGVGVNLAVQDAVAAANLLARPLREGRLVAADLAAVERRRMWPVRVTQAAQVLVQNHVITPALRRDNPAPPLPMRLLRRFPWLQRFPARFVGLGLRPELPDAALFAPEPARATGQGTGSTPS